MHRVAEKSSKIWEDLRTLELIERAILLFEKCGAGTLSGGSCNREVGYAPTCYQHSKGAVQKRLKNARAKLAELRKRAKGKKRQPTKTIAKLEAKTKLLNELKSRVAKFKEEKRAKREAEEKAQDAPKEEKKERVYPENYQRDEARQHSKKLKKSLEGVSSKKDAVETIKEYLESIPPKNRLFVDFNGRAHMFEIVGETSKAYAVLTSGVFSSDKNSGVFIPKKYVENNRITNMYYVGRGSTKLKPDHRSNVTAFFHYSGSGKENVFEDYNAPFIDELEELFLDDNFGSENLVDLLDK